MKLAWASVMLAGVLCVAPGAEARPMGDILSGGAIRCGVVDGLPGLSEADEKGNWRGLGVDLCRALSAAVFGEPDRVTYSVHEPMEALPALRYGRIDLLPAGPAWTLENDTAPGLAFAAALYHEGHGFMVRRQLDIASALELSQASVCASGAGGEVGVRDFFQARKMPFELVSSQGFDDALQAYVMGRCNVLGADLARLHATRPALPQPDEHMILPEVVARAPLGPMVRRGDGQWLNLVRWTVFALVNAEELNVTSANAADMRKSGDPRIARLLGQEGDIGAPFGLPADWAYNAIRAVGNYGEMFERNLGNGSPLRMERGSNRLSSRGGFLFAPPIR